MLEPNFKLLRSSQPCWSLGCAVLPHQQILSHRVVAKKRILKSLMPFEVCAGIPYGNGEDLSYALMPPVHWGVFL